MKLDDDIQKEREKVRRLRELRKTRIDRLQDLRKALREARELVHDKHRRRRVLKDDELFELDWSEEKRKRRIEALADDIEDAEAELDDLVLRVADVSKGKQEASRNVEGEVERLERLIERRKRIKENREGRLTEHFHVAEFDCRNGTPVPQAASDALEAWCRAIGEPLRKRFGAVSVNSGYRTQSYNASVGGESNSVHIYDLHPKAVAVDVHCESGSARDWYDFTAGEADGRGLYSTFHHADNRNRIGWPDATWSG
jgi:hypothetical protein